MYLCMEKQMYVFRRISQNRFTSHPQNQKKEIINDLSQQDIVESALFLQRFTQYRLNQINRNITESMMQTSMEWVRTFSLHFLGGKSNFSFVFPSVCEIHLSVSVWTSDDSHWPSADRNSCLLFCNAAFVFCARPQCIWPRVSKLVCLRRFSRSGGFVVLDSAQDAASKTRLLYAVVNVC